MSLLRRYESLGESFDPDSVVVKQSLRLNPLRIDPLVARNVLEKKGVKLVSVPFSKQGFFYEADFSLGATPEFLQGWYYLQEAASQLPPIVLNPLPGDSVLDMAAAPGSKTTQLAALMKNQGTIVALDSEQSRLASLRNNLERCGVSCAAVYKKDARFASDLKRSFDKVLLDAPCSGNFCIEPSYFSLRSVDDVRQRSRLQKELLKSAYKVLKSGGTLVYSTCSLEPEEDELVVDWFLRKYPDMSLADTGLQVGDPGLVNVLGESLDPDITKCVRIWPHKTGMQGFFLAKFEKTLER